MIKIKCKICGEEFSIYPSQIKYGRKHCGYKCAGEAKKLLSGPNWKTWRPRARKICIVCGKEFFCKQAYAKIRKTCSRECVRIYFKSILSGKNSPRWKGGIKNRKNGYICRMAKAHPCADKQGYVLEHRLVMEKHLGRYLDPKEVVHHIDENIHNNHIDNLKLFSNTNLHTKFHSSKKRKHHGRETPRSVRK